MPQRTDIKKIMVIGSGPIIIGQAAEFDYAGTQACRALTELGYQVVLVNSNPATIMTDTHIAHKVYVEPLTPPTLTAIIAQERPDALLPTLGGQMGLNLAVSLAEAGVLEQYGVVLLGTQLDAIRRAEDRELFKQTMQDIGEPIPPSVVVSSVAEALAFARENGYPVIVRPAYTLGGTGGGIAYDEQALTDIVTRGLRYSSIGQVLVEQSLYGWKELEYEVMRDSADNCIVICNMENIDPVGVHTGDSIVVAPSQTLSDKEYQMLRSASLNIIRALKIEGGCNVQFALDPTSNRYYVIEVNPRVSRSSALASKATGYPIAKIAAKIATGLRLDEIINPITGKTTACFEPALDYVVVKIPRWPFDKFTGADRKLGTQMKSTGEVMAIGRTFEAALLKAVRSLDSGADLASGAELADDLATNLVTPNDRRLFAVLQALRQGWTPEEINEVSCIDFFFLHKLAHIVALENRLRQEVLSRELLWDAKQCELSDGYIARLTGRTEEEVRCLRRQWGIKPVYKMVDTCAAEFEAATPYYYSAYEEEDEVQPGDKPKILVLGSGPIRIGQGIEFDYSSVHAVWAVRQAGYEAVIINNNPETVSTDFDTGDRLYFEPLTLEDVLNVVERERPEGVIVQCGGQTAINLAAGLAQAGVRIIGTPVSAIDLAEDREKCDAVLAQLRIPRPAGRTVTAAAEAPAAAQAIGYPVVVRPSYVLGGRAMEIVYNEKELLEYTQGAVLVSPDHPILIDKYLPGIEVEVDAAADGETVVIPGIMQHVERAGVHSGDSIAVYPASLPARLQEDIVRCTVRIARRLDVVGLVNIQYVVAGDRLYVLEVNPRASRTVPFISKVTGVPLVKLAVGAMLGHSLARQGYHTGLVAPTGVVAVKAPVFSFAKLTEVDTVLGPEMKSTGEVMGLDETWEKAMYKALVGAGLGVPPQGRIFAAVAERDKAEVIPWLAVLARCGYTIEATAHTAAALAQAGVEAATVALHQVSAYFKAGRYVLAVITPTRGKVATRPGFAMRRAAVEYRVPCLTAPDTLAALARVVAARVRPETLTWTDLATLTQRAAAANRSMV